MNLKKKTLTITKPLVATLMLLPFLGGCTFGQGKRVDAFLAKMQSRFDACDTDHDGYLTSAQAEGCMPRVAEHFAEIDADHDGKVSFDEISVYVRSRRSAS